MKTIPYLIGAVILMLLAGLALEIGGSIGNDQKNPDLTFDQKDASEEEGLCEFAVAEKLKLTEEIKILSDSPAEVNFDGEFPEASEFRTQILDAVQDGANFAGHYTVAEWSCGESCQRAAVIDIVSGEIIAFGLESSFGFDHDMLSRVLVTNPADSMPAVEDTTTSVTEARLGFAGLSREFYIVSESQGQSSLSRACVESASSHYLTR